MSAISRRRGLIGADEHILWLYKDGDECTDVTGGWGYSGYGLTMSGHGGPSSNYTKYNTYFYAEPSPSNSAIKMIGTLNQIDFSNYNYLKILTNLSQIRVGLSRGFSVSKKLSWTTRISALGNYTTSIDISNISSANYVWFWGGPSGNEWAKGQIKRVWLEK